MDDIANTLLMMFDYIFYDYYYVVATVFGLKWIPSTINLLYCRPTAVELYSIDV